MISWDSPLWGQEGFNVHLSENGSDVPDRHGEEN